MSCRSIRSICGEDLLDTNVLSDVIRNSQGRAARQLAEAGDQAVCTSVVVAAELWYGAIKRDSNRLTAQVDAVLGAIMILAIESPVERIYGALRARLERAGRPIGGNDLLIAAQSISLGLTLVTDNKREFSRIAELPCANWLRYRTPIITLGDTKLTVAHRVSRSRRRTPPGQATPEGTLVGGRRRHACPLGMRSKRG